MVFNSSPLDLDVKTSALPRPDWSDFYNDVEEKIPHDAPEPRGRSVEMLAFMDSDHAGVEGS